MHTRKNYTYKHILYKTHSVYKHAKTSHRRTPRSAMVTCHHERRLRRRRRSEICIYHKTRDSSVSPGIFFFQYNFGDFIAFKTHLMRIVLHSRRQCLPDLGAEVVFSLTCIWRQCQNQHKLDPLKIKAPPRRNRKAPHGCGHRAAGLAGASPLQASRLRLAAVAMSHWHLRGGRLVPGVQIPRVRVSAPRARTLRLLPTPGSCASVRNACPDELCACQRPSHEGAARRTADAGQRRGPRAQRRAASGHTPGHTECALRLGWGSGQWRNTWEGAVLSKWSHAKEEAECWAQGLPKTGLWKGQGRGLSEGQTDQAGR